MNLQDMMLAKLADVDKDGFPYRVQLNCVMSPELDCPESIRIKFPENIMFIMSSTLQHELTYDYETRILSFYANFGGTVHKLQVPAANITHVLDELDNSAVQFLNQPAKASKEPNKPVELHAVPKDDKTNKTLMLVVDNTKVNKSNTKSNTKLRLVVDNTKGNT